MLRLILIWVSPLFILLSSTSQASELDLQYQQIRGLFLKVYSPVVQNESGLELEIRLDTEAPDYFGGMAIQDQKLVISIGSKAHHDPAVTPDAYLALLCHEVGHRLGGAPFKDRPSDPPWSSTEGQSDYYAASVCLEKVYSSDSRTQRMIFPHLPKAFHQKCEAVAKGNLRQKKICLRIIKAGKEMAEQIHSIYRAFPNPPNRPDLMTPEASGQSLGFLYPSIQCRLDTFIQGALKEPRPGCWFLP